MPNYLQAELWVITWCENGKDIKTEVIDAPPWLWLENKMEERYERAKHFAALNGKPTPPRPPSYQLYACWKVKDIS